MQKSHSHALGTLSDEGRSQEYSRRGLTLLGPLMPYHPSDSWKMTRDDTANPRHNFIGSLYRNKNPRENMSF